VEKIKTLLRLALESPSENMSLYKHIRLHSLRMLGGGLTISRGDPKI
jgi:hypothetical protein